MKLILGIFLICFGVIILARTYLPIVKDEIAYKLSEYDQNTEFKQIVPVDTDFGIVIPKIKANAKVIPNVNPFNESEYQVALSRGVAHASTSKLPGKEGNVFIFSHSSSDFYQATRYNSVFYLLSKLDVGDDIFLYYDKEEYVYKVTDSVIVNPEETDYLLPKPGQKQLTLMTCWPPGTSLKRLIVQAEQN